MKNFAIEIRWAIIAIVLSVFWIFLEKSLGLYDTNLKWQPLFSMLIGFAVIPLYYFAIRDKKKNFYNGVITWKQGFFTGLIITFFVMLSSPLCQYISHNFIAPDFFKNAIVHAVSTKRMTQSDAEAYFNLNSYITQSVSKMLSFGVMISGVVSYLLTSKKS